MRQESCAQFENENLVNIVVIQRSFWASLYLRIITAVITEAFSFVVDRRNTLLLKSQDKMESVLSDLNFDEGIAMPVANLENKQLESQVSKN